LAAIFPKMGLMHLSRDRLDEINLVQR